MSVDVLGLGPVQVWAEGRAVAIDRPLERAVLVRLALADGVPVPDARLAEDLWGAEIERPVQRLRVVVSRLRSTLGPHADVVARTPAGYRTAAVVTDLRAAESAAQRMHAARRGGDLAAVRAAARESVANWRGDALADLRAIPFAMAEGERLDDWRLQLTVAGLTADLELGAAGEVLAELSGLVTRHPLHEQLSVLLALALYRTGRQGDALDRLARLRRALADELGVDPSPDTAALEARILDHDPALHPPRTIISGGESNSATTESGQVSEPALGAPDTVFLGRSREIATLTTRLAKVGPTTVTGVAGSGKSRLAVELARAAAASGRSVVFVELAPLAKPQDVAPAVLAALESGGLLDDSVDPADPLAAIAAALGAGSPKVTAAHAPPLLVLDNVEHVIDAATGIVGAATGSSILLTSQSSLPIPGETVYPLGPLERGVAVELFAERAGVRGLLTAAERDDVVHICAAVDWLPLGIELAAGLTRAMTISQVAKRIDDRVRLLVGGARDAGGGRHTSLRVALDWSYELLADRERTVLRRFGIFAGGCTLEAAEAVLPGADLDVGDIAPALADLVNRSLVTVQSDGGAKRFALLETVRDYSLARLAEAGEIERLRASQLEWCRNLVETAETTAGATSADAVAAVFAEWPNILAALENAPGTPRAAEGLRLALAMHVPWLARARFAEACRHFAALVEVPDLAPAELAQGLCHYGFHLLMAGDLDSAAEQLARAAVLAEPLDDLELAQTVRYYQGIIDIERAALRSGIDHLRLGERLADRETQASSFADALGSALLYSGDAAAALAAYRRSIEVDKAYDNEHGLSRGFSNEARALLELGEFATALSVLERSDYYARRLDDRQILPLNDLIRAGVAAAEGQLDAAESYCRAAYAHEGDASGMARVELADVLIAKGELDEAQRLLTEFVAEAKGIPLLAAHTVRVTLLRARGAVAAADELAAQLRTECATTGFGWRRYVDRLTRDR
ncbi:tetratricopeptide repeat protein [Nocardia arthritidis]|uniref:Tetratricopeptide repeat protein n=1 Tax=Nocardia arthritidis TaxID=228602 RepID=A0A6G9YSI8_9NOCA|nr:tetratricopeptide repeat protein [Nocardia arthritidis]